MEKILKTTLISSGKFLKIRGVEVDFGNDKQAVLERLEFNDEGNGVMMVALDEENNIFLVEQFQVGCEERLLVLPRGGIKTGFNPEEMARQELEEEIGLTANKLVKIAEIQIFPGYVKAMSILYLATELSKRTRDGDELETINVIRMQLHDAVNACIDGKIVDSRTIAGILLVKEYLQRI